VREEEKRGGKERGEKEEEKRERNLNWTSVRERFPTISPTSFSTGQP